MQPEFLYEGVLGYEKNVYIFTYISTPDFHQL
jgi:hypothetical protein